MTVLLSHNLDLYRVQIALSDLADGTVEVQRSAQSSFNLFTAVRGGANLPVSGGAANLDDFEYYEGAPNFYRVVPVDPPPGLRLDGTAGGYASTPDDPALDIVGDVVLTASIVPDVWPPVSQQSAVSRYRTTDNQRSARLFLRSTGLLAFAWSVDGTNATTTNINSTVAPEPDPVTGELHARAWLDTDFGGTEHRVLFYTAPSADGPWSLLGDIFTGVGTTSVHQGSAPLEVGSVNEGALEVFDGSVQSAHVFAGNIVGGDLGTGTVVADPDFAAQPHGTTGFTDDAGRVWTVNGTALIVGAVLDQDSITPSNGGAVVLKSVRYPAQNTAVTVADYEDVEHDPRSLVFPIAGRALPTGVTELHGGRNHALHLRTRTQAEQDRLDVLIRTGDVFFLQVPTTAPAAIDGNLLLPGSMHVLIGRPVKHRIGGVSDEHLYSLPLTEVARPGPDVVGTTLTVGGLVELHGSVESVWAAYPTIRDLWDTIGSLDSLLPI